MPAGCARGRSARDSRDNSGQPNRNTPSRQPRAIEGPNLFRRKAAGNSATSPRPCSKCTHGKRKGRIGNDAALSFLPPSSHIIRAGRLLVVYDLLLCALFSIKLRDGFGSPLISSLIVAGDTSLSSGRDKVDCATFLLRLRTKAQLREIVCIALYYHRDDIQ